MVAHLLAATLLAQSTAQRASSLVDAGVELANQGRFPEAGDRFVQALALDPKLAEAHYLLGLVRHQSGRTAAALASFRTALKLRPAYGAAQSRICELETVFARSRETGYERALAECRIAMRLDPAGPEPHFHAGWNLSKLGNRAAAILEFRTTLRLDPKYPNAKFELAMAYADSQNTAAAAGLLKEVAAAEPENGNVRFQLGSALARQGDCASAVPLLEAAPEAAETYYILGGCLKKLNRPSEAEGAMAKVKQLREDSAARTRATFLAATAHKKAEAGDLEGAIADYRASLEKRNDPAVAIDLAVALLKKREAEEVIRLLQRDASPLARYQIALAYTQAGQPDAAKGALEAALAAKPDFAEAWYQLGVILLPGDNAGAERALASAVRLRPDEAPMRLAWAEALEKCGQPAEAKRQRDLAARLRMLN